MDEEEFAGLIKGLKSSDLETLYFLGTTVAIFVYSGDFTQKQRWELVSATSSFESPELRNAYLKGIRDVEKGKFI